MAEMLRKCKLSKEEADSLMEIGKVVEEFRDDYKDLIKCVSPEDLHLAAGVSEDEMFSLSLGDVYELIRERHGFLDESSYWFQRRSPEIIDRTNKVKNSFYLNNSVSTVTFDNPNNELEELFRVASLSNKADSIAEIGIRFEVFDDLGLSAFDKAVYEGVASNYLAGNDFMTVSMVYSAITGGSKKKVHKTRASEVEQSIEKMLRTWIEIEEDGKTDKKGNKYNKKEKGHLLNGSVCQVLHKGVVSTWYNITSIPILYKYASEKNQVITNKVEFFELPFMKNKEIIVLQRYLFGQINWLKNGGRSNNVITLKEVYWQFGIREDSEDFRDMKSKTKRIRDNCKKILDYWKSDGYIKGYGEEKSTGKIESYFVEI